MRSLLFVCALAVGCQPAATTSTAIVVSSEELHERYFELRGKTVRVTATCNNTAMPEGSTVFYVYLGPKNGLVCQITPEQAADFAGASKNDITVEGIVADKNHIDQIVLRHVKRIFP